MDNDRTPQSGQSGEKPAVASKKARLAAERKKRLEANLRTNLRRRKSQDRSRSNKDTPVLDKRASDEKTEDSC